MKICSGYGCVISNQMTFGPDDFKTLSAIMNAGSGSPAAERKAIKSAISYMEKTTRNSLRYSADTAFSYQKHAGKRGQMDCVDESLNTTAYLKYLYKNGLLKHHTPISNYASRGLLIDGRYPHKSARMKQKGGQAWAVDSWKSNNGGQPEIMPLSVWYKDKNSASDYR